MFAQMLVMHLVGSPDRPEINRIGIPENFKALVDKYIMHQKVGKSVQRNTQSYPEKVIETLVQANCETGNARRSENHKEVIILFKEITVVALVMIVVQEP